LKEISSAVSGDVRAAISDLQTISAGRESIKKGDSAFIGERRKDESIFDALKTVLRGDEAKPDAFENVDRDLNECMLWVDENLPLEYAPSDLEKAYNYLSKADIFRKRIVRWQYWRFLVYMNAFLAAGVSVSKKQRNPRYISYKRPSRLLKIWLANQKNAKKKAIAAKLAKVTHCSKKRAMKEMHFLKIIFENNKESSIPQELMLNGEEISFLKSI